VTRRSQKADREALRGELAALGCTPAQMVEEFVRRLGARPRLAWRWAMGWTQWKLAMEFRLANPGVPVSESRISEWEAWPHGGTQPSLEVLSALAATFGGGCTVAGLVDSVDLTHMSTEQRRRMQAATSSVAADPGNSPAEEETMIVPFSTADWTRREALGAAGAAAMAALSWGAPRAHGAASATGKVGAVDVARVRSAVTGFSRADQRHGGGRGRQEISAYLGGEVRPLLEGRFASDAVRQAMFAAAAEAAYLAGWMSFDDAQHAQASSYFTMSLQLADEARDPAMAAHTLRAMAHQAIELGRVRDALGMAEASVSHDRYLAACPRERSLLGVVHARALATAGLNGAAGAALVRAEDDLAAAEPGDDEPGRVFFFSQAALAHETGRTLYAVGDLAGAETALAASVRLRGSQFTRTHAVTLGYLGEIQATAGHLDQACDTWSQALEAMGEVRSARASQAVTTMRHVLEPVRDTNPDWADLDHRAATYLATA